MCDLTAPQGVIGYEVRDGRRYEIVDLGTVIVTRPVWERPGDIGCPGLDDFHG